MNKTFLKVLGLAAVGALLLGSVTTGAFASAGASSSNAGVSTYARTTADLSSCSTSNSATGSPISRSSVCASNSVFSSARARAYASNGANRAVSAYVSGSGVYYRAEKAGQNDTYSASSTDSMHVVLTTSGLDWNVAVYGRLSGSAGAVPEYEGEQIFFAVYPDSNIAKADYNKQGISALYAWKAVFVGGGLTFPTMSIPNQFNATHFSVGGGVATTVGSLTFGPLPIVGDDNLAAMGCRLGTGGGTTRNPVPSLSTWGLLGLTALLLAIGSIVLFRRRSALA
jgi:hypothetical protein